MNNYHVPIMVGEILNYLNCRPNQTFVDCTLGDGGHALEILERTAPDGILVAIDQDLESLNIAKKRLAGFGERVIFVHDNFCNLKKILNQLNVGPVDGILADLGISSSQLSSSRRGFSFNQDALLDMRMDEEKGGSTAADLLNELSESELSRLIKEYGEERWARRIARNIIQARQEKLLSHTYELVNIIYNSIPAYHARYSLHPATRTFQALRIAVNVELKVLKTFLEQFLDFLKPGARICIISFHSLEDRMVKEFFYKNYHPCTCPVDFPQCVCGQKEKIKILTKKPIIPSKEEQTNNSRSCSAKLRVAEKI